MNDNVCKDLIMVLEITFMPKKASQNIFKNKSFKKRISLKDQKKYVQAINSTTSYWRNLNFIFILPYGTNASLVKWS